MVRGVSDFWICCMLQIQIKSLLWKSPHKKKKETKLKCSKKIFFLDSLLITMKKPFEIRAPFGREAKKKKKKTDKSIQ